MPSPKQRKKPTQERSRKRVEAILDAAGDLFADRGVEATTMEAIAERAGTSIGSVYQYFEDKQGVFLGVAERELERSRQMFTELVLHPDSAQLGWRELLAKVIDGYAAEALRSGRRSVIAHVVLVDDVARAELALHDELIEQTVAVLQRFLPDASETARRVVATTMVDTISGVLVMAARRSESRRAEAVQGLKAMLTAYLDGLIS